MLRASKIPKTAAVYHRKTRKGCRYIMRSPLQSLEAKIAQIKQEITGLGADLQPGRLTQQYNVCGKAGCRCKATPPAKTWPLLSVEFHPQGEKQDAIREAGRPTLAATASAELSAIKNSDGSMGRLGYGSVAAPAPPAAGVANGFSPEKTRLSARFPANTGLRLRIPILGRGAESPSVTGLRVSRQKLV